MKILVTGANGFLGHHLIKRLDKGNQISVLLLPGEKTDLKDVNIIEGDISNYSHVQKAVEDHDIVINLAGVVSYWYKDNEKLHDVNVLGAKNIAKACLEYNVQKLVHISSVAAVGDNGDMTQANEETTFNLFSLNIPYSTTKYLGEIEILKAVNHGLNATILCPGSIYGEGDVRRIKTDSMFKTSFPYGTIYLNSRFSVVDVNNVIDAILSSLNKQGGRYIIVSENLTYKELKTIICEELGVNPPTIPIGEMLLNFLASVNQLISNITGQRPKLTPEMARYHNVYLNYDNSKSKKELGIQYVSIRDSIRRAVKWYRENGYIK